MKIFKLLLTIILGFSYTSVFANNNEQGYSVYFNGEKLNTDVLFIISNGHLLIPYNSYIDNASLIKTTFDNTNQEITYRKDNIYGYRELKVLFKDKRFELSSEFCKDGNCSGSGYGGNIDNKLIVDQDGIIYISIKFIMDKLGVNVHIDEENKEIDIHLVDEYLDTDNNNYVDLYDLASLIKTVPTIGADQITKAYGMKVDTYYQDYKLATEDSVSTFQIYDNGESVLVPINFLLEKLGFYQNNSLNDPRTFTFLKGSMKKEYLKLRFDDTNVFIYELQVLKGTRYISYDLYKSMITEHLGLKIQLDSKAKTLKIEKY